MTAVEAAVEATMPELICLLERLSVRLVLIFGCVVSDAAKRIV